MQNRIKNAFIVFSVSILILSCTNEIKKDENTNNNIPQTSLEIILDEGRESFTFLVIETNKIKLEGLNQNNGTSISLIRDYNPPFRIDNIEAGQWKLTASTLDKDNNVVRSGTITVDVLAGNNTYSISIVPIIRNISFNPWYSRLAQNKIE